MAVLTATALTGKIPHGEHFCRTFSVTIANANAADEWIVTGLSKVITVLGIIRNGTAVGANLPAIVKNAAGTGQTADTTMGALALEGDAATYEVTVVGRA
jgi:hypothetical protein